MDTFITVVAGLVGVLVGSFVAAYASSRASIRTQGQAAARLAADGLSSWTRAVRVLKDAEPNYPRDDRYDIYMAISLGGVRPYLTMDWWEANRAGLVAVASEDQWAALTAAAQVCRHLLMSLSDIGDVGKEVWNKRAKAIRATRASASASKGESDRATESRPSGYSDPQMAENNAEANRIEADVEAELAELAELVSEVSVFEASLDIRLWKARDLYESMISAGPKFDTAVRVCRSLHEATQSHLGLLDTIRRQARRRPWSRRG